MTRPFPRSTALLLTLAGLAALVGLAQLGAGSPVATSVPLPAVEPAELADPVFAATPAGYVDRFAYSLNAGDVEGVLASLDPEVEVLYLPGVAGIENPTIPEVRAAFDRYAILDATITIDQCADVPGQSDTTLDCTFTFNSNFSRGIGLRDPQLFMRFVVGPAGIDATYLSPFVVADGQFPDG